MARGPARGRTRRAGPAPAGGVPGRIHGHVRHSRAQHADRGSGGHLPAGLRGLLNGTANYILSKMADGTSYAEALAEAQRAGLAEPDPAADVGP